MSSINFLRQQQGAVDLQTRKDKRVARYTASALIIFLVVVVGIVVVRFMFTFQQNKITNALNQARTNIAKYSKIEQEYIIFAKKVQLMNNLDKQREAKRQAMQFFYALIPTDNVIQQVQLDATQSRITFQVVSPDVFRMLELLKIVREKVSGDVGYTLQVTNLARKPDARYIMSGSLGYNVSVANGGSGVGAKNTVIPPNATESFEKGTQ